MDYMKLVADLCQIIDRQNEITKAMAAVRRDYATAMGEVAR